MPRRRRIFLENCLYSNDFLIGKWHCTARRRREIFENCLYINDFLLENRKVCRAAGANILKIEIPNGDFSIGNHEFRGSPTAARRRRIFFRFRNPRLVFLSAQTAQKSSICCTQLQYFHYGVPSARENSKNQKHNFWTF
jgi:hypothetical protein